MCGVREGKDRQAELYYLSLKGYKRRSMLGMSGMPRREDTLGRARYPQTDRRGHVYILYGETDDVVLIR